jgi:ABC-type antimicrobial peptide transport system permease subunit
MTDLNLALDGFDWKGKDPGMQVSIGTELVSHDYGKTVDWKISAGRDFSRDFASDSTGIILSETAVKYMGLKNPIGEVIKSHNFSAEPLFFRVIGVVKDVLMESPYEDVRPMLYVLNTWKGNFAVLKLNPMLSAQAALAKIALVFQKHNPSAPFDYKFVDAEYSKKFAMELRVGRLAGFFAILAVFISCLGLFGLASFMAEQRTKEIGIRKVLGASLGSLWQLLSKDFVLLVFISFFIATPIAYYFMSNWLQTYTYHTEISWWIFVATGLVILGITLLTVSYQSMWAALTNPIKSLRSE